MVYEIVKYGSDLLRKVAIPVEKIELKIERLVQDLLDSMYHMKGLGLASQQIGFLERVCVVNVPSDMQGENIIPMPLILINPVIVKSSGNEIMEEGCLSFPKIFVKLRRPYAIEVEFMDMNWRKNRLNLCGLTARAVMHEVDHLDGILIIDRMSPSERAVNKTLLEEIARIGKEQSRPVPFKNI